MPKDSTIFDKPFLRFMFSQYYRNDLLKTQQPHTPLKMAFRVTKSWCRLNYQSILGKWSPLCPQEKEDQRQGSCQTDMTSNFYKWESFVAWEKKLKMWNVNLQLLLHLWIQLQSLEAWKRTMSISVTKWRWPYQVLKARLHSFH